MRDALPLLCSAARQTGLPWNPPDAPAGILESAGLLQVRERERKQKLDLVVEVSLVTRRRRNSELRLGEPPELDALAVVRRTVLNLAAKGTDRPHRKLFESVRVGQHWRDPSRKRPSPLPLRAISACT